MYNWFNKPLEKLQEDFSALIISGPGPMKLGKCLEWILDAPCIFFHTWTFQRVPNGSWRVSIYHPLGFNGHPLEGAGMRSLATKKFRTPMVFRNLPGVNNFRKHLPKKHSTWKWMVGIWSFPFGMAYVQVRTVCFREGIFPEKKMLWTFADVFQPIRRGFAHRQCQKK